MEDFCFLEQKYARAPISWAVLDIIQQFIEDKKGNSFFVTMKEIRNKIIACKFDPCQPEMHQILAKTDPDFVRYVFECAKGELQSQGFIFSQIGSGEWKITKSRKTV